MPKAVMPVVMIELECENGHQWVSKLVCIAWDGPLFADAFCPTCYQLGRRRTITSESIDGLLSDDEIAHIGQRAIHTFLFLVTQMFDPENVSPEGQKRPTLSGRAIGMNTAETEADVEHNVAKLCALGWIDTEGISYEFGSGRLQHTFIFGTPWHKKMAEKITNVVDSKAD